MIEENSIAEGWQDFANCLGVDPDLFSLNGERLHEKRKKCVGDALFVAIAWSTHYKTVRNLVSGAV